MSPKQKTGRPPDCYRCPSVWIQSDGKLQDDGEYAYMVQNAAGAELARVDSTAHHDAPFGPDVLPFAPGAKSVRAT
jgi:hypothetical protein